MITRVIQLRQLQIRGSQVKSYKRPERCTYYAKYTVKAETTSYPFIKIRKMAPVIPGITPEDMQDHTKKLTRLSPQVKKIK